MKQIENLQEMRIDYKRTDMSTFKVTSSNIVYNSVRDMWPTSIDHREAMVCLYLNRNNRVVSWATISIGGISGTIVDLRVIFQKALLSNSTAIILVHNHPSGNLNPSATDTSLTTKVKDAGNLLDIQLLDHLIITTESYYSFADYGIL